MTSVVPVDPPVPVPVVESRNSGSPLPVVGPPEVPVDQVSENGNSRPKKDEVVDSMPRVINGLDDSDSSSHQEPSLSDSQSSVEVMRNADVSTDTTPSICVTSPSGGQVTTIDDDKPDAPSIIVTSPSDGSIKGEYSPPATPMTSLPQDVNNDSLVESDGEDYYEEYHLPNTHESAFVRHLSFRKRVQKTKIFAPDADRIEGLLKNGEFERHGSIRRRILPEEDEFDYYDDEEEEMFVSVEGPISRGVDGSVKEIEKYLSEENLDLSYSDDNLRPLKNKKSRDARRLKRSSSTPVVYYSESDHHQRSIGRCFLENAQSVQDMNFNEFKQNVSIEDSTLKKIRQCLDFSSYRDLLNLSGKLSDLLSPKEVEELVSHSERYRQYFDNEVFDALSLSYRANMDPSTDTHQSPTERSTVIQGQKKQQHQHPDSGFSSPKTVPDEDKTTPSAEDLSSVNGDLVHDDGGPQSLLSTSGKVIISAPRINLDSSTDSKIYDSDDEDNILSQIIAPHTPHADEEPLSYQRMVSVTEGIFDHNIPDDLCYDHRLALNRPRSDSMNNLEHTTLYANSTCSSDNSAVDTGYCPPPPPDLIPELSAAEEVAEERHWRNVVIGGMWRRIDMKVIAPYKQCVTHGGYLEASQSPVIVISSVYLPDKSRKDYNYVMNNLFMYVLSFVEQLVADDYVMVYLAGGRQTPGPGFQWMRKAYDMIDRRLRKNLKTLLVVHPSLWARTIVAVSRPFISSKFYRKLHFIQNLTQLAQIISLDQLEIPDSVKQVDFEIMIREKKKIRS